MKKNMNISDFLFNMLGFFFIVNHSPPLTQFCLFVDNLILFSLDTKFYEQNLLIRRRWVEIISYFYNEVMLMQTTVSSLNRKGKEQVEFLGGRSERGVSVPWESDNL